jgi:DNA-binding IclR family transcriptional regulator
LTKNPSARVTAVAKRPAGAGARVAAPAAKSPSKAPVRKSAKAADVTAPRAPHPWGTQSIHRAVTMLREIAAFQKGMRLVDIANAMSLERPTAHRIVKGLMSQGMVVQDPTTKCYRLGHVVYELGLAASPNFNLKEVCQPTLVRLAERTADSVYLVVRSGFDSVCIDRLEGSYPIRTRTLEVGTRRPLGIGAASVALMLGLSDAEIERIIDVNSPRMSAFGQLTGDRLRDVIAKSRAIGYALNEEDVLPGVAAIGAPIVTRGGQPYAAISLAGITARFEEPRREELSRLLLKEARSLARKLDELSVTWE